MVLKERDYWLGFNIFPGIGPKRFYILLKKFGSAKKAWQAKKEELQQTNIPYSFIDKFIKFRLEIDLVKEIIRVEKRLIRFIIVEDKDYPLNLKNIKFPPPLLYIKGQFLQQDNKSLAVVGTRKITSYGREITEKLTRGLAVAGFTIVSGLARGVDSVAHRTALENYGRTIAVLGSGLDKIYPPENLVLAEKIVNLKRGVIVSQLPLGMDPLKGNFPSRNRIISGLSLGVLVTEGASHSGAKITSQYAFKQSRYVFAAPGPITSPMSEAPADLIKNGAKLITQAKDIFQIMKIKPLKRQSFVKKTRPILFLSSEKKKIWQLLISGQKNVDEIIRKTGLSSAQVLSLLTEMELASMVKNVGGGKYIII